MEFPTTGLAWVQFYGSRVSHPSGATMHERIQHSNTPVQQVMLELAVLFSMQGIPCVYSGTEQG